MNIPLTRALLKTPGVTVPDIEVSKMKIYQYNAEDEIKKTLLR